MDDENVTYIIYIYVMKFYQAINKNKIITHAGKWITRNHYGKWNKSGSEKQNKKQLRGFSNMQTLDFKF